MLQAASNWASIQRRKLASLGADTGCLIAVALLTAVGAALRIWQIRSGLFGDELLAYQETAGSNFGQVLVNVSQKSIEVTPPLFFVLANAAERFGDAATTIRVPAEIGGILLIPAVFLLGKVGFNRRVGLLASALTAVNVHAIYYSVEARPYSLVMLFSALSTICLLKLIDDGRSRWLAGYTLSSAAVVYSHYSGIGVLIAQLLWAMWLHRDLRKQLLAGNIAAAVLFAPWLPEVTLKSGAKDTLAAFSFGAISINRWARQLVTLPYGDSKISDLPGSESLFILGVCLTAGLIGIAVKAGNRDQRLHLKPREALFPILVIASPAVMLLASLATGLEFLQSRYFSASFPALIITVAAILALSGRRLGVLLSVIAVAVSAVSAVKAEQPAYQRPDMRAVARWIEAPGHRNALIADWISPFNGGNTLRPYLKSPGRDTSAIPTGSTFAQVENATLLGADLVLVTNGRWLVDAEKLLAATPKYHLKLVRTVYWPGLGGGIRATYFIFTGPKAVKH